MAMSMTALISETLEMFDAGYKPYDIAMELEVRVDQIYRILRDHNRTVRRRGRISLVEQLGDSIEEFLEDYDKGMLLRELVKKYALTNQAAVYQIIRYCGVTPRSVAPEVLLAKRDAMDHAVKLYDERPDVPIWKICRETGVGQPELHDELHERGVTLRRDRKREQKRAALKHKDGL